MEDGEVNLPKYYHVLKTHKLATEVRDPSSWLETNGYPVRGMISGRGAPLRSFQVLLNISFKVE